MAIVSQRRFINPRLGTYFGILTAVFFSLVLLELIFEQLGVSGTLLRSGMLLGPIALYIAVGVAVTCQEPGDYFAAGRRVPAVYAGLGLAGSAIGATGLVACTGLFFINGFDAWCIAIGVWAGFVCMALLVAPYYRKFGAYTVPSYLGRRFENRLVRLVSAGILFVPTLLIAVAELRMGAFAAGWLSGASDALMTLLLVAALVACVVLGGTRSLTWSNTAQAIIALLALLIPVAIVAALETNLPLPQLSHGPVLRGIGRLEAIQGVPIPIALPLTLDFAGQELHALAHRMAQPYASVGPLAFVLMSLTVMCGVATAPWLLPRCGATLGVYDTRKACAWAVVFGGLTLLTAASVAVFLRDMVMDSLVGHAANQLPGWFERLRAIGVAATEGAGQLPLGGFSFKRDAALFMLPIARNFPEVGLYLALAGVIGAALLGASSAITSIGLMLAEDGVSGLVWEPAAGPMRINLARGGIAAVAVLAGWIAMLLPADPLDLMLWALALSASSAFPVVVLSIWWKRLNAFGSLVGMSAGFGVALLAILAGEAAWLGMPGPLAAVFGMPAGLIGAVIATRLSPLPGRHVMQLVRDLRLPGGETMHDREIRLQRMKHLRGP